MFEKYSLTILSLEHRKNRNIQLGFVFFIKYLQNKEIIYFLNNGKKIRSLRGGLVKLAQTMKCLIQTQIMTSYLDFLVNFT